MSATIVITGASGFLGRQLLAHFLAAGREVVALTRNPSRLDDVAHPRLCIVGTDYGPSVAGHLGPSCSVIHLAAQRHTPVRRPEVFANANVSLAETLARSALAKNAGRFIHISTALVLGSSATERDESAALDDRTGGAYVRSRIAGLLAVERVAGDGLPLITLLPSIIFGPDHPRAPNRITSHIRRVLRMPLRVAIAGRPSRRNLVYVDDVTNGIARAEQMERPSGRHLVSGENVTQEELEAEVRAAAGESTAPRVVVPRIVALAAARTMDAILRFDAASGWTNRMHTLLAPWCFRLGATIEGPESTVTPFSVGVRRTVDALRARGRD